MSDTFRGFSTRSTTKLRDTPAITSTCAEHGLRFKLPADAYYLSPKVYSLLIGINHYASSEFPDLLGAVSDMQRIKDFLTSDLSVPEECIVVLADEDATRERIVLAIQELASPKNGINKGDPILIYFAGHGSTVRAPQNWTSDPTIQVLVPHDGHSDGTVASSLITDRKFGSLLRDLANEKGDNITVILDCCHSTSGTRSAAAPKEEDKDFLPRGVELKQTDNPNADVILAPEYQEEFERMPRDDDEMRSIATSGRFLNASMRSHILLAACGENQLALEKKGSGVFTTALLTHFKARGIDSYTYAQIIVALGKLARGRQTPQCEGAHRHERKLFDSRAHFSGYAPRSVHFSKADNTYTLTNAGQVHGVTPDTEFAVYASFEDVVAQAGPLCYLLVDQIDTTTSTLRPRSSEALPGPLLPTTAVAFQFQATHPIGDLRIYIPNEERLQFVYHAIERGRRGGDTLWSIEPSDEKLATLGVVLEGKNVAFNILDEDICSLGLTRLRFTVPATVDHVAAALRSAAHYFFHLNRMPETPLVRDKIRMHVYELEETDDLDDDLRHILRPLQPQMDLIAAHKDLAKARMGMYAPWTVIANDVETYYGIELQNETKFGLFLSMFYFDCGTLEIRQLYSFSTAAPGAHNLDRPLRPEASLSLNYGSGGGEPLRFVVDDEHSLDFGI
ncbi:caspase domain-containing protein, partial [Vararia minispora EC-137]